MALTRNDTLSLRYVLNVPSGKPDSAEMPLVICMHGRGADMNDLADLAPMLDGGSGIRFLFPNAPKPFEAYPGMTFGWTWFDGFPPDHASLVQSREQLLKFIDEAVARFPTPKGKLVLAGFSQGALMALDAGFRTRQSIAGIIAMSGGLYEEDLPNLRDHKDLPVLIVHGSLDDVLPVNFARRARRVLEEQGLDPEYHEFGMGHHVTEESMRIVAAFLLRIVGG